MRARILARILHCIPHCIPDRISMPHSGAGGKAPCSLHEEEEGKGQEEEIEELEERKEKREKKRKESVKRSTL